MFPGATVDTSSKTSLFVTWEKKRKQKGNEYALRGCIGTFARLPILKGIERYSIISALQDRRFPPITKNELPLLRCSCNILQNFETIYDGESHGGDIFNWELGVHGIELMFKNPQTGAVCSATFLPDVMTEQNWDKRDTFINLIEKAGFTGNPEELLDNYKDYFVQVIKYQGNKSRIAYNEFIEFLNKFE